MTTKYHARVGWREHQPAPPPVGAASVLLSTARVWPIPLAGIFTFCFPSAVLSVLPIHHRLSSAKREGPREGGSEPKEAKHPRGQNRKGAGPRLSWLGGCFQIRGCPKSMGPGRGNGGRVSMTEGWAGSGLSEQGDCIWTPGTR